MSTTHSHTVTAYRRTATHFYVAPENGPPGVQEKVLIAPEELTAALARDGRVVFGRNGDRGMEPKS